MKNDRGVILFDVGNTLLFLDLAAIVEHAGPPVDYAAVAKAEPEMWFGLNAAFEASLTSGTPFRQLRFILLELLKYSVQTVPDDMYQRLITENKRCSLWRRLNPEAVEALTTLKARGYRLGVVSNADGKLEELLNDIGLLPYFEVVIDSVKVGVEKPDRAIFEHASSRLQVPLNRVTYVGDLPAIDVVGAQRAGATAVLYDRFAIYSQHLASGVHSVGRLMDLLHVV